MEVNGDDSNAIILLEKKKNKNKKKEKEDQVSEKLKAISDPKLSKSQKRKLKKLEEEKEMAILLSKSIETLEKYKIRDDAYSLMWSSRNLGQVETVREKRQREVQFSKAGLELPDSNQHFKKRTIEKDSCEGEHDSENMRSSVVVSCSYKSAQVKTEVLNNMPVSSQLANEVVLRNKLGACDGYDGMPVKEVANENIDLPMLEFSESSLSKYSHDDEKTRKFEDNVTVNHMFTGVPANSSPERALTDPAVVHVPKLKEHENEKACLNSTSIQIKTVQERPLVTPTVVHVTRPTDVENQRKDLPIVMMEQEIMEAINENMSLIICGETGCGKTTQVPQFLYEAGFGSSKCNVRGGIIGVTQPRRVAVLATAKRVAFELGLRLGKEVGFQVRHDRRIGDNCSIKFMTDGILLREVQNDFLLKHYSIIILDEAHERSLNTDILVGMLSRVIQERQREYEEQQKKITSGENVRPENRIYPLKLILMSATLRVEDFVSGRRIFNVPPPVIEVPTRQYPVTIHFSKRTEIIDYIGQAYKKVLSIHKRLPPGGILVFVTGQREVEYLCRKLRKASRGIIEKLSKGHDEMTPISGENSNELHEMEEISEAFEIQGNSNHEITTRFSLYDEGHEDYSESESELSDGLKDERDLEIFSDDEDLLNQKSLESNGSRANVLQEDGSFTSLKAAFEALAGKKTSKPDSEGKQVPSVAPEGGSNELTLIKTNDPAIGPLSVLPLYAMLPASAQLRVFEKVREGERLVVVATNVAETSLTIPGIKYVVDTGREKTKKYDSSTGMETYEIQWISKASAAQRAGRAGRTGPGHCYRLYSPAVFSNIFPDFSSAEISKVPVDGVVLLMKSMHIGKVANFPFPTPPEATAIVEAEHCLKVLEALDIQGRLTPLGKAMARYPMSPRHSRMLLTVIEIMQNMKGYARANLVLGYAVAAASALSLSNPFIMQFEGSHNENDGTLGSVESEKILDKEEKLRKKRLKEKAKVSRARFSNPTSDALTTAYALQCFELSGSPVEFCTENALHLKTMEEMSKLRKQLLQLVFTSNSSDLQQKFLWTHGGMHDVESSWRVSADKNPLLLNEEEILGQAICAGWADRVAKRIKAVSVLSEGERKVNAVRYQACMAKETVFLHRWSSLSKSAPEFMIYSELLHTKRPYIHGATSVKSDWLVKYACSMCSFSSPHSDPKPYYDPVADQVFCWVTPTFGPHLWQLPLHGIPIKDDMDRVAAFAYSLLEGQVLPCLKAVRKFMAASPASILRPEASGVKRVGNLLNKLKSGRKTIDSCAILKELWEDNPRELFPEIQDWFQEKFQNHFEELWRQMYREALLHPKDRFSKKFKKIKRRK